MDGGICELEQAESRLSFDEFMVLVEGKRVRSYNELLQLATQDTFKDNDLLEVVVLKKMAGG